MKNGKFLAGIIAGLGTGAILGILFAPDKGSKTRKRILNRSCDATADMKVNLHDVIRKNKQQQQQQHEETDLANSVM